MDYIISCVLLATVIYCLYYHFKSKLSYFDDLGIPSVPGAWPLIGNMQEIILRRKKNVIEIMTDLCNVHPEAKYIGVYMFTRPTIFLRDPELIKNVCIKNFENCPDRTAIIDHAADPFFGASLFNMSGERWREARNLLSPAFTSSKLRGMFELMRECGQTLVDYLAKGTRDLGEVDTKDLFTRYTNDVIATCAFGISIDSLNEPENEFYVQGKKATHLGPISISKFWIQRNWPWFAKFFNIRFLDDRIAEFFKDLVRKTIALREKKGLQRPDIIQLMMDARDRDWKHIKLDITEITGQAFVFFFGGFESSANQMSILAHELAVHTDVQTKLQEEIDDVLEKTGGKPTYESVNGMRYLDAVWNESFRIHAPFPIERYCVKAFELPPALPGGKPVIVEPGTNLGVPTAAIHRFSKYYDDPLKFDPDRYLDRKVTINDPTNIGFGIGPRACIGNRFAVLETKVLFFYLLSKFNLRPSKKTCVPLVYDNKSFSLKPKGGFWLAIEPRRAVAE